MKYRYLVVDDEPLARKLILSHASCIEGLENAGECNDAIEANNILNHKSVDLIFLDIQMPHIDGLQFLSTLTSRPDVIVTTAFRDFAPEAFDLDVIDYLLKPISIERFIKAVNKFLDRKERTLIKGGDPLSEAFVYIKADRKINKVALSDIVYIESLDDYIKVHLRNKVLISRENISTMEEKLRDHNFVRIHRSFIVSVRYISAISNDGVELNGSIYPFGRAFRHSALSLLGVTGKLWKEV